MSLMFAALAGVLLTAAQPPSRTPADTGAAADSAGVATALPRARITLDLGAGPLIPFAVQRFDLQLTNPGSSRGSASPVTGSAEASFARTPGAYSAELARRSAAGERIPFVTVEVLDSAGAAVLTLRLANVLVRADRIITNDELPALEQQRMGLEEGLAQLGADYEDARRDLAAAEQLERRKFTSRDEVARARERADVLRTRLLLRTAQARLLAQRIARAGPLEEQVTLAFPQFDIQTAQPGGSATVSLEPAPRGSRRPR